jgi:ABC-2 type transport system ATP-binding protein
VSEGSALITVTDLSMHYGTVVALHKVNFAVQRGEVVGLLGPNGAGKSTTMKILTTYLYPTAGIATVGGQSVLDNPLAVRKLIGYLPEVLPLYPEMEVGSYLDFVGRARGLRGGRLHQRIEWVVQHCGQRLPAAGSPGSSPHSRSPGHHPRRTDIRTRSASDLGGA